MAFIAVSGVAIHCRDEGPRDAPVVLFANSLGSDLRIWDDVAGRLAATRRVVRYDKRGHGLSDAPPGPYSLADQTRDALGLLDALGVDRFAMVGVSVGGLIAQAVALEAAARLTSLVLVDSGAKIGTAEGWDARIAAVRDRGLASISRGIVAGWLTPAFREERPAEAAGWRNMLERTPRDGYLATCAMLRESDLRDRAGAIRAPTLCVAGEHDATTPPALARETAALIEGARAETIPGAAHIPCIEKPAEVAALIEAHLSGARHG